MIRGIHAMFYSTDAEATRAFLRDKIGLPFHDVGEGWLIFDVSEGDIGVHPTFEHEPVARHSVSLYCDDIEATVAELKSRGVEIPTPIEDRGWGLAVDIDVPGTLSLTIYQPRYSKG